MTASLPRVSMNLTEASSDTAEAHAGGLSRKSRFLRSDGVNRRTVMAVMTLPLIAFGNPKGANAQSTTARDQSMKMVAVNPPGSSIPGISQGMIVEAGRLLFLSGHVPILPGGSIAGPGLEAQLERVFENLSVTLKSAGASASDVARLTIYIRDYKPDLLSVIRGVRDRFVDPSRPPASALVGVAALFHPDVLVEVDAIAALPT